MFLYVVDKPFNFVLFAVKMQLSRVTEFFPSTTIPSEVLDVRVEFFTVTFAVEYILGDPTPFVV